MDGAWASSRSSRQPATTLHRRLLQQNLPRGDLSRCSNVHEEKLRLLDHLVGAGEQRWRHFDGEGSGSLQVNHELVLGRVLHREISWPLTLENAVNVSRRTSVRFDCIGSKGNQPAGGGKEAER